MNIPRSLKYTTVIYMQLDILHRGAALGKLQKQSTANLPTELKASRHSKPQFFSVAKRFAQHGANYLQSRYSEAKEEWLVLSTVIPAAGWLD